MFSPVEESEPHLIAVGRIAVRWATLDSVLALALGKFLGNMTAGYNLYHSAVSNSAKFDMLSAALLSADLPSERRRELQKLVEQLGKLWKRRNVLLHNPFGMGASDLVEPFSIIQSRPLRKEYAKSERVTLRHLSDHADSVSEVGDRIFDAIFRQNGSDA